MMSLSLPQREQFLDSLPRAIRRRIRYTWELWARPGQLWRPGPETYTIYLAGRRFGKTRAGAEAVRYVADHPELCDGCIGIAGRTANDVNETMLNGPSGLLNCYPPNRRPRVFKSGKVIEWRNGVTARLFSGEEPSSFRGPGYGFLWADELPHWTQLEDSWANAVYALSSGAHVRAVVTTTPIGVETLERLVWLFDKETDAPIIAPPETPPDRQLQGFLVNPASRIITGSTYENAANLAANYLEEIIATNEGTATADQEIRGQILRDVPNALWRRSWIRHVEELPDEVDQVVVAVDPSGSVDSGRAKSAEVGIVVVALGIDGLIYVIEDCSGKMSPEQWGARVWQAVDRWNAEAIACETNYGGDMVPATLRACRPRANTRTMIHRVKATTDKAARASMYVPLYQTGRVVHCGDPRKFVHLERQMTSWDPTKAKTAQPSPDRLDALGWGILHLVHGGSDRGKIRIMSSAAAWREIGARIGQGQGGRPSR